MSQSESDDDAPSVLTFQQSKIHHENFDNQVKDFLKDRRSSLKEKRRLKEETLKSQKVQKLKRDAHEKDAMDESPLITTQQKYQHQKRFLPAGLVSSLKGEQTSQIEVGVTSEGRLAAESTDDEHDSVSSKKVKPKRMKRKIYEKFNIRVEAHGQLENKRTATAVDFKARRLGKVHRESINRNAVHQEKLLASGQLRFS